ncbi:unnamed protein product [Parajaminaea phylloscopi]
MDSFNFGAQAWPQPFPGHAGFEPSEVTSSRNQLIDSMQRLSSQFREAANFCDRYAQAISRSNAVGQALTGQQGAGRNGNGADLNALLGSAGAFGGASSPGAASSHEVDANGKKLSKRAKKLLRQARDPHAPKRPPSAYLLFQNEVRDDMRQRNPEMPYKLLLGKISDAWKELTEDERRIYQDKTNEEMKKWNLDKKDHITGSTGAAGVAAAAVGGGDPAQGEASLETDELVSGEGDASEPAVIEAVNDSRVGDESAIEGQLSQPPPPPPSSGSSKKRSKDKEVHKREKKSRH